MHKQSVSTCSVWLKSAEFHIVQKEHDCHKDDFYKKLNENIKFRCRK